MKCFCCPSYGHGIFCKVNWETYGVPFTHSLTALIHLWLFLHQCKLLLLDTNFLRIHSHTLIKNQHFCCLQKVFHRIHPLSLQCRSMMNQTHTLRKPFRSLIVSICTHLHHVTSFLVWRSFQNICEKILHALDFTICLFPYLWSFNTSRYCASSLWQSASENDGTVQNWSVIAVMSLLYCQYAPNTSKFYTFP